MKKIVLLSLVLFIPYLLAQEQAPWYKFYFDADADAGGDGSLGHPYKYLSELTMPENGLKTLYFFPSEVSYQYDENNSTNSIFSFQDVSNVELLKYGEGTVSFAGLEGVYEYGIYIGANTSNILIEGINFGDFYEIYSNKDLYLKR